MNILKFNHTAVLGADLRLFHSSAGGTAYMECPHGQLCSGLTDGLGGNDADGFTHVDHVAPAQIAAVAHGAHTTLGTAGKY